MRTIKIIMLLLLPAALHAGDVIRSAVTPQDVTLYLRGAKVTATASVTLQKGRNKVLIQNLPGCIDDNSYKIGVENGVSLISFAPAFKKTEAASAALATYPKDVMDSIYAGLDQRIQEARDAMGQNTIQLDFIKDIISSNKQLEKSDVKKDDGESAFVTNLTGLIQIYETKSDFYLKENRKWTAQIARLEKEKAVWTSTFYPKPDARPADPRARLLTKELTVELVSAQARTASIEISYFVSQASWIPSYDLKVADVSKPMEIVYKGKIYQSTGQDWDAVHLKVSAYTPRPQQDRPILNHLYVNYQWPQVAAQSAGYGSTRYQKSAEEVKDVLHKYSSNAAMNYKKISADDQATYDIPVAQITQEQLNVSYGLQGNQTVLSDSAGSTLVLATQTAGIDARYYWIPRQTNDVYLVAWLKNWDVYHFLDGEANIFFNDNYVGKTRINTAITGDEFPVSLGIDERVIAKRSEVQDKEHVATRKEVKTETHRYELSVRNNTPSALQIDVYDQVPVSESDKVKIENIAYGAASYLPESGSLHWDLKIARGNQEKMTMGYSLSYPLEGGALNYYNR